MIRFGIPICIIVVSIAMIKNDARAILLLAMGILWLLAISCVILLEKLLQKKPHDRNRRRHHRR